jgi:hypothetical protein
MGGFLLSSLVLAHMITSPPLFPSPFYGEGVGGEVKTAIALLFGSNISMFCWFRVCLPSQTGLREPNIRRSGVRAPLTNVLIQI